VSTKDRASNTAQEVKGKLKEAAGSAVGNSDLESEGKSDQAKADLKRAGESVKETASHVKDALKDA
jgi:uncharacterized protein YjbJ (UPF0337 family)